MRATAPLILLMIASGLVASACGGPPDSKKELSEACARQVDEVAEEESGTPVAKSTEEREGAQNVTECAGQKVEATADREDALEGEPGKNEDGDGAGDTGGDAGGEGSTADAQKTPAELDPAARELFITSCGVCHTLSDADTNGQNGPNLDETDYDEERVAEQIDKGAAGMPPGLLQGEDAASVAAYVAAAAAQAE